MNGALSDRAPPEPGETKERLRNQQPLYKFPIPLFSLLTPLSSLLSFLCPLSSRLSPFSSLLSPLSSRLSPLSCNPVTPLERLWRGNNLTNKATSKGHTEQHNHREYQQQPNYIFV